MIEDGVKTVIYTHIYMYTQSQTQNTHITQTHRTKIIRLCFFKSALHTAPDHCTDPRSEDLSSFMTSARKAMTSAIAPAKKDNRGMKKKKGRGACSENKSKIGRHTDGICRYATAKRTFPKLQRPSSAESLEQDEEDEVQDRTMCAVQGDVTVWLHVLHIFPFYLSRSVSMYLSIYLLINLLICLCVYLVMYICVYVCVCVPVCAFVLLFVQCVYAYIEQNAISDFLGSNFDVFWSVSGFLYTKFESLSSQHSYSALHIHVHVRARRCVSKKRGQRGT